MSITRTDQIKLEGESHKEWSAIKLETDKLIQDHPDWAIKIIVTLTSKTKKGDETIEEDQEDNQLNIFPQSTPVI